MTGETKRYRITHRTTYTYSDDVSSSYGRTHLTPRELPGQRITDAELIIEPEPSDRSTSPDVFGNTTAFFHINTDHRTLVVTNVSTAEVDPPDEVRLQRGYSTAPWEDSRPTGVAGALATEFVLDLVPPEITDAVRDYAAVTFTPGRPLVEVIRELTTRIFTDFTYKSGSTTNSTKVAEVMEARSGVCQDFARIAIACLRSQGLAARYVSGYLSTRPPPGKERMIGVDASHAWAAVWLPDDEWLAFDPTNNQLADERYITVSWGRDYADVPPLRGIIYTDSKKSTINVSVDVAPLD
ncbi:transglutaminase family protein [Antrihabitans cavernicola]|uniref:Transglutaminase family protein n=1 Tax=Antrihabitans cavernicola TaxID=2495913 RepID=A0A5A7SJ04_9NOCA|nr:transglutaminase family protein [Spelaeibacter cavernicola]KAA0024707.1 transglutaminase family protein [Spelaeibacter cavernicola]